MLYESNILLGTSHSDVQCNIKSMDFRSLFDEADDWSLPVTVEFS